MKEGEGRSPFLFLFLSRLHMQSMVRSALAPLPGFVPPHPFGGRPSLEHRPLPCRCVAPTRTRSMSRARRVPASAALALGMAQFSVEVRRSRKFPFQCCGRPSLYAHARA